VVAAYKGLAAAYRSKLRGEALAESNLTPERLAKIQQALIGLGFLNGEADGEFGPATRAAIRKYQEANDFPQSDFLSAEQRESLVIGRVATRDRDNRDNRKKEQQVELEKTVAQGKREQAEGQIERKQQELREQAERDRQAAEEALRRAEREEPRIAQAMREAEEARRARQAAEQRLAEIRSRVEVAESEKREALAQSKAAEDKDESIAAEARREEARRSKELRRIEEENRRRKDPKPTEGPKPAEFGETNVEQGCIILSVNVSARIEDLPLLSREGCAQFKAMFKKAKEGENVLDCALALSMTRNRLRNIPDLDAPNRAVRVNIIKGCAMVISDIPEKQAAFLAEHSMKD
jgi:peptidoglycan hydrolase-like protein with peptidoglycan-binding domain